MLSSFRDELRLVCCLSRCAGAVYNDDTDLGDYLKTAKLDLSRFGEDRVLFQNGTRVPVDVRLLIREFAVNYDKDGDWKLTLVSFQNQCVNVMSFTFYKLVVAKTRHVVNFPSEFLKTSIVVCIFYDTRFKGGILHWFSGILFL